MGLIGHEGLLRAFTFATTRHAQTARDLGLANNLMLKFPTAPLSSSRIVPRVTIARVTPFTPLERPHVNAGYLRLPQPTQVRCIACAVERRKKGTPLAIRPK